MKQSAQKPKRLIYNKRNVNFNNDLLTDWGKATYGGPVTEELIPKVSNYYMPFTYDKGESGIMVPICLPS
ncbi:benzyl alcohol O-benzoyltransferase [Artemisia annua]|uniref:Benzyl alcohol O-benzoyltransferase n=1 Tax=Artemisia annua TaxID=35608 RepID=A0A2U1M7U7_ARTAN|nr:benzyl alcohol O-benzoyltransferase [Artemisia annua]